MTLVDRTAHRREIRALKAVWPQMEQVAHPEDAEWLGPKKDLDEEEESPAPVLPEGFLSASFRAGDHPAIVLRLAPDHLPNEWHIRACGRNSPEVLSAGSWRRSGSLAVVERDWQAASPPERLLVQWGSCQAFLAINVEDERALPPPAHLESMSADDMLGVLASTDPSAAFRAWAKRQQPASPFDDDLDSAVPIELDPLRRYDLQTTFLHRIRRRARILAQMRSNLERPVWSRHALEWRLRGLVGVEALADRLLREFVDASGNADEPLLTLADFLIVLREIDYQPNDGSLPKGPFENIFRSFLRDLADRLTQEVHEHSGPISEHATKFWRRVVKRCQE